MLSSWNETLVQGTMPTMTATIRRFVDTLVQRPPHNGLVFDLGRRAIPAANVHEALLVWTAFTHQGYLEPSGLQDTLDTLRKTPLTHNLAFAHVHPDTLRAMLPTP